MINWKVRFKNPTFIFTVLLPGLLILTQMVAAFINNFIHPIGFTITDNALNGAMGIINFIALTFFGVGGVVDHTTKGLSDSDEARKYEEPK
ncbi:MULTISPECIES: phage holin [Peribacillus]|uniref:phage holin n=1 Tax=Peribacillus TaxID=2675229 RepID=UPI0028693994|nr:phage holin [Peribacillus sp. R9-11]WMX56304.1 phage holin [Peribacillus sp. R9-11]